MRQKLLYIVALSLALSACGAAAPSAHATTASVPPSSSATSATAIAQTPSAIATAAATPTALPSLAPQTVATTSPAPKVCNGHPGKLICLSKKQGLLFALYNGRVVSVSKVIQPKGHAIVAARFGGPASDGTMNFTRESTHFQIFWKDANAYSHAYHVKMPFFMAFSGGEGIHYSSEYARGYRYSHGCVGLKNVRFAEWLYHWTPLHTRVIVTRT